MDDKEDNLPEPPPYETILNIPDWNGVPQPPAYSSIVAMPSNEDEGLDPAYPPPVYEHSLTTGLPNLAYADFMPNCIHPGDAIRQAEFDDLKTLMTAVNFWLSDNPKFSVCRCESIERKIGVDGSLETETTIRFEGSNALSHYVRGVRLWLKPKAPGEPVQQLWYMNVVPQTQPFMTMNVCFSMGKSMMHSHRQQHLMHPGMMMRPQFENLDNVLQKLNSKLQTDPLPGQILTIESIDIKFAEGFDFKSLDPDSCSWSAKSNSYKLYLTILRIFFIKGPPIPTQIGIRDFTPLCTDKQTSVMSLPKFESLTATIQRASNWISQQNDIRMTNTQVVEAKLYSGFGRAKYDSRDLDFTMTGEATFIKFIRIPYVMSSGSRNALLTSRAFVPVRYGSKQSETTSQTVARINNWLRCTGANVIGVDTMEYEFSPPARYPVDMDHVVNYLHAGRGHYWISCIRLYIDGYFNEPPPELFNPSPTFVDHEAGNTSSNCCAIQ